MPAYLRGVDRPTLERALREGDPLPGGRGFAGRLDGRLVRDVLGRQPLFTERDDPAAWSFDRSALSRPDPVPAGHVRTAEGDERVWTLPDPAPRDDPAGAVDAVEAAVLASAERAAAEAGDRRRNGDDDRDGGCDLAVAFSGGVDSALLAALFDAPLYVAGFPDSHDVAAARSGAALLGRDVRVVELAHADLERAVPEVAAATGRTNAMDVGIALPLYLAAERAAADGADRLVVGQGADELFGGYAKVAKAPDDPRVEADAVRGAVREVVGTLPAQLERDVLALRAAGVEPVAPYLDDRVVVAALELPEALLVDGDERKVALRRAAADHLPAELVGRDKKAAQYGSLVARELDRLARRAGFKRRVDDHVTRYVESLVEG